MANYYRLHLQLFAEGGDGAAGAAAQGDQGGEGTATVIYGVQPEAQQQDTATQKPAGDPEDRSAAFEELIKGDYKDQYAKRVEDTVNKRLKGLKGKAEGFDKLQPMVELLARKYGIEPGENGSYDHDAILKAAEEDGSWIEDRAAKNGLTIEQQRQFDRMERENAQLHEQMQQRKAQESADKIYAQWMGEAEALKKTYGKFDLEAEMQNPDFLRLLQSGVSMEGAFKAVHMDELMRGGMEYAVRETAKQAAAKVAANGNRPRENGSSGNAAAIYKSDVNSLTDSDLDEVIRRVKNGERISFG